MHIDTTLNMRHQPPREKQQSHRNHLPVDVQCTLNQWNMVKMSFFAPPISMKGMRCKRFQSSIVYGEKAGKSNACFRQLVCARRPTTVCRWCLKILKYLKVKCAPFLSKANKTVLFYWQRREVSFSNGCENWRRYFVVNAGFLSIQTAPGRWKEIRWGFCSAIWSLSVLGLLARKNCQWTSP